MARRVRVVALPTCGNNTTLSSASQLGGHIRLVDEHVQTRPGQPAADQQLHQRVLVYDAATRNVDQVTLGAQCLEDGAVDQIASPVIARGGDDQDIDRLGQLHGRLRIAVRRPVNSPAVVIRDGTVESEQPGRDRRTDASQAQNSDLQAADIPGVRKRTVLRPSDPRARSGRRHRNGAGS